MAQRKFILDFYNSYGMLELTQTFSVPIYYYNSVNMALDNNDNIYVYIEYMGAYLFRFSSDPRHSLTHRNFLKLTNDSSGIMRFANDYLYLIYPTNAFVYNSKFEFVNEVPFVYLYQDYEYNGYNWYASDGKHLMKYNEDRDELLAKKLRNMGQKLYFNDYTILNECVLVTIAIDSSYTGVLRLILLNDMDSYELPYSTIAYPFLSTVKIRDGKIFLLNSQEMSITVFDSY